MAQGFTPYFGYKDAAAAIDFLVRGFGFETGARYESDGKIMHAELRCGDGVMMVGSWGADEGGSVSPAVHGVYVVVDDVDEHFRRAVEAGAEVVWEPHNTEFGTRRHRVRDAEGYEWSFGSYRPGAG